MKFKVLLLVSLIVLTLSSCRSTATTTKIVKDPIVKDPSISLEDKLSYLGYEPMEITYPQIEYDGQIWVQKACEILDNTEDYFICGVFLGSECDANEAFYEKLKEKAKEGVQVYMVIDGSSAEDMTKTKYYMRALTDELRESGVHLFEYNVLSANRIPWIVHMFAREHRKYFVSDGLTVALGGMNMNYVSTLAVE